MNAVDPRVRRQSANGPLLEQLQSVFETFADALMFAAAIGHRVHRRLPLTDPGEGIRYQIFANRGLDTNLDLLAVAESGDDLNVLEADRLQERIQIFEELANGGLERIRHAIEEMIENGIVAAEAPLRACISLIEEYRDKGQEDAPDLALELERLAKS
jgi:dnd system-associated protein 4